MKCRCSCDGTRGGCGYGGFALGGNDVPVPVRAPLGDAGLGAVVHVDQAEAFVVAFGPFEVVHEGPREVAADVHAVGDRLAYRGKVAAQVVDAFGVADLAVRIHVVVERGAVFRDV